MRYNTGNIRIRNYKEYLIVLKRSFGDCNQIPSNSDIYEFIDEYKLKKDWGIVKSDVIKDIRSQILNKKIDKKQVNEKERIKKTISTYEEYSSELEHFFGKIKEMPSDSKVLEFIDLYSLGEVWNIEPEDVKTDLKDLVEKNNKKTNDSVPNISSSKSPTLTSNYYSNYALRTNIYTPSYDYEAKEIQKRKQPSKSKRKNNKSESEAEETIFIDGDNHFDEGQKGIERTSKNTKVRAIFSQPGAKRKFDKKYGQRPNVSSRLVKPGNQAVDNQIKTEAGQILKKGNQKVTLVSQDKGFEEYAKRKNNSNNGNKISVAKSVKEKINKSKKK